jgi:exonuclease III
MKIMF